MQQKIALPTRPRGWTFQAWVFITTGPSLSVVERLVQAVNRPSTTNTEESNDTQSFLCARLPRIGVGTSSGGPRGGRLKGILSLAAPALPRPQNMLDNPRTVMNETMRIRAPRTRLVALENRSEALVLHHCQCTLFTGGNR